MGSRCWTLSPSDLAFLWEECPRCFYLKVVRGFPRPRAALPEVLARLGSQMKVGCDGRRTETLAPDMPAGVFELGERELESHALDVHLPDTVHHCRLHGNVDTVVRLDGGGYALVAFETGARPAEQVTLQARALHGSAYALEHPAPGASALGPITRLGVLVFEPEKFTREAGGLATLAGGLRWIEVPRDDATLFGFLAEVLSVLEAAEPPGGAPLCQWCVYRDASRRTGL